MDWLPRREQLEPKSEKKRVGERKYVCVFVGFAEAKLLPFPVTVYLLKRSF
jgi:hypothetical protein